MCGVLEDLLIGIVSGIISGILVTVFFKRRDNKKEKKIEFKEDVQSFHRWILRVRNELEISYRIRDLNSLLRAIEEEPILHSFDSLSDDSLENKQEATRFIRNLVKDENNLFEEKTFKVNMGLLFKYSVEVLKYRQK